MLKNLKLEPNPIIVKEMRSRMRGGRPFATLTAALLFIVISGFGLYSATLAGSQYSSTPTSPLVGQMLFFGLAFLELFIMAVVVPAITASEISSEKEKQTYEMLLTTPLNPTSILWGKFVSSLSYIFIMIFAAIPMASVVFIYGGVNTRDMVKGLLCLIIIAIFFAAIGLFFSTWINRTTLSIILTYLVIFALLFGPVFAAILISAMQQQGEPPRWVLNMSPIMVLASTIAPSVNSNSLTSSLYMLGSPVYWILGSAPISTTSIPRPAYHYILPLYILITMVLYLLSTHLIRPIHRWRVRWTEVLMVITLMLGFLSLVSLAFIATAYRYENVRAAPTPTPLPAIIPSEPKVLPPTPDQEDPQVSPSQGLTPTPEAFGWYQPEIISNHRLISSQTLVEPVRSQ